MLSTRLNKCICRAEGLTAQHDICTSYKLRGAVSFLAAQAVGAPAVDAIFTGVKVYMSHERRPSVEQICRHILFVEPHLHRRQQRLSIYTAVHLTALL